MFSGVGIGLLGRRRRREEGVVQRNLCKGRDNGVLSINVLIRVGDKRVTREVIGTRDHAGIARSGTDYTNR